MYFFSFCHLVRYSRNVEYLIISVHCPTSPADHGIGITEANDAKVGSGNGDGDFGDDGNCPTMQLLSQPLD